MSDGSFPAEGGCQCGEIRYRLTSAPMFTHCCHCTECQRITGTSYAVNALIEADRVEVLQGEAVEVMTPSSSGKGQRIYRCPTCQTPLWSHYAMGQGLADKVKFVRVGTLDDPGLAPPDVHIFTRSMQDWEVLPEGVPAVEIYYKTDELWPAESLARRAALTGEG